MKPQKRAPRSNNRGKGFKNLTLEELTQKLEVVTRREQIEELLKHIEAKLKEKKAI